MPLEPHRGHALQCLDGYQLQAAGYEWDAVRVPLSSGAPALAVLGPASGAVIEDPRETVLYWLVPPGTTAGWDLQGTRALGRTHHLVVPDRGRVHGPGPRWRLRPDNHHLLTDVRALRRALESVSAADSGVDAEAGP